MCDSSYLQQIAPDKTQSSMQPRQGSESIYVVASLFVPPASLRIQFTLATAKSGRRNVALRARRPKRRTESLTVEGRRSALLTRAAIGAVAEQFRLVSRRPVT